MLKILYASDLHGSDIIFKKLVNAATIHKVNVIIVGGDITGKGIVPIVREKNTYISSIYGTRYVASSQDELKELVKRISNLGFYPYIFEKGEEVKLNDQEYFNQLFTKLSRERLLSWINYAEEKMKDSNV
ncbi:MAG: metallophosphoesterase, partial [Nitrososphaerota archaeon]